MIKDIIFVCFVITAAAYAHTHKNTIIDFMQCQEGKKEKQEVSVLSTEMGCQAKP